MGHRRGVTGMASDGGADPGGYQHCDIELPGVLGLALAKRHGQAGRNLVRISIGTIDSGLALIDLVVRVGDYQAHQLLPVG